MVRRSALGLWRLCLWYVNANKAAPKKPTLSKTKSSHSEVSHLLAGDKNADESLTLDEFVDLMIS